MLIEIIDNFRIWNRVLLEAHCNNGFQSRFYSIACQVISPVRTVCSQKRLGFLYAQICKRL